MLSAQEDFGDFVAARWGDLEAVALVTTLDPAAARDVTATALAGIRPRWGALLEEGVPTTAARAELLQRLVPPPRRMRAPEAGEGATRPGEALVAVVDDADDVVPVALLRALADEEPLVRCALAAEVVWELTPPETGRLLERADVAEAVGDAYDRLVEAHRAARAADGFGPADHLLDADLEDLVHRLAAVQPEPPDAWSLVGERVRRVRRRAVVAGGGVLAAAGAATWWGLAGRRAPTPAAAAPPVTPSTAGPDAPAWAATARWPARGVLATDLGVQALVARTTPGGRLLYADDVHEVRCVVAMTLQADDVGGGTQLRVWAGSVGAPAEQLTEVPLGYSGIFEVEDVVAVGVPHPTAAVLLVLSRPTVDLAQYSLVARPTRAGLVSRTWRDVPLTGGVGSMLLDAPSGPAARVRCADYDGPLPTPQAWAEIERPSSGVLIPDVAEITGFRPRDLTEQTVLSRLPASISLPQIGDGRVTVRLAIVRTPDGGVVRSVGLSTAGGSGTLDTWYGASVVPAARAQAPFALRADDYGSGRATWVITVPPGGTTVQLTADDVDREPLARPAAVHGHAAVVRTPEVELFRVVVRDARGRVLWDDPPLYGVDAYDTYPQPGLT